MLARKLTCSLLLLALPLAACGGDRDTTPPASFDATARRDSGPKDTGGVPVDSGAPGDDAAGGMDAPQAMDAQGGRDAVGMDAVAPGMDAVGPGMDAVGPGMDAVGPGIDTGMVDMDAGVPGMDAVVSVDAGMAGMDAGTPGMDAGTPGTDASIPDASTTPVDLTFLTFSDWHGQLDPLVDSPTSTVVGGAAVLSAYFQRERMMSPNTLVFTAGDAFGGTPPLSGFFDEEPAVRALNLMGIAADTFGNHNFDRGTMHLQRMIDLAQYRYVSSNLNNLGAELRNVAAPFHLIDVGGVRVGLVGITNPDAPTLVFPGRMGSIIVADPVASAIAARDAARAAGARVLIALVHMGATARTGTVATGPLMDFARAVTGFHLIAGDHVDLEVNTVINDQLVVQNRNRGRTYARVQMNVVPATGQVLSRSVTIVSPIARLVTPDPAIVQMLAPYRAMLTALLDQRIGGATGLFARGNNVERLQEVPIGDLLTDAMRVRYATQIAFTNSGGIRAPLPSSYRPADTSLRRTGAPYMIGPPYDIVLGDAYEVLPFGNVVVTRTLTGRQIWQAMEHGVSAMPAANGRFPQVSGFRFTYTASSAPGMRVLSVTLDDGTPVPNDNSASYTAAVFDFINAGGDGYTMLADGMGASRELGAQVLAEHIRARMTITPTASAGRITRTFGLGCNPTPRAPVMGDLLINEILADPPAAPNGDANGDGTSSTTQDEFVEIGNVSNGVINLSGVVLSDSLEVKYTFGNVTLGCGQVVVVFGGGNTAAFPPNWFASMGLQLNNTGGESVRLGTSASTPANLASVTFGSEANNDSSLVREVDLMPGVFVRHTLHPRSGGRAFSPGRRVDNTAF